MRACSSVFLCSAIFRFVLCCSVAKSKSRSSWYRPSSSAQRCPSPRVFIRVKIFLGPVLCPLVDCPGTEYFCLAPAQSLICAPLGVFKWPACVGSLPDVCSVAFVLQSFVADLVFFPAVEGVGCFYFCVVELKGRFKELLFSLQSSPAAPDSIWLPF
jgi:hypothetical protein